MIKTRASVTINRPVERVFAYVTRVDNFPVWFGDLVRKARQTSPGALGKGTKFDASGQFLGKEFDLHFVVTGYEPDRLFCVSTHWAAIPFRGCFNFEQMDESTLLTDRHEIDAGGIFDLVGSLLVGRLRDQAETNLANLKRALEEQ
jgi:uncharacterized protein YndB with AHSA1/START domain